MTSGATVRGMPAQPAQGNYVRFKDGTWQNVDPADDVYEDIIIPGVALRAGSSAPDLVAFGPSGNILQYGFNGASTTEEVHGAVEIPHSYKEGSVLLPHVHWAPSDGNAGDVKWQLEYTIVNAENGTGFPAPTTIGNAHPSDSVAWKHHIDPLPEIDGTGLKIGAVLAFRLFRDPTDVEDTYGSDAILLSFGIHFQQDTFGSEQVFIKGFA